MESVRPIVCKCGNMSYTLHLPEKFCHQQYKDYYILVCTNCQRANIIGTTKSSMELVEIPN
jgi:hypothetical protein